jgi:hypothetical protein
MSSLLKLTRLCPAAALIAGLALTGAARGDGFAGLAFAEPEKAKPAYPLFSDAPPMTVIPRKKTADLHSCRDCHEWAESNPTPRALNEPHVFSLNHGIHGKGKFWCFTCHHLDEDGGLRTLEGEKLDFDQAYVVCSQCHSRQTRDWFFGAHGKRIGNWRGERQVLNCTVCHYQHSPRVEPRAPRPPRPVPSYTGRHGAQFQNEPELPGVQAAAVDQGTEHGE